MNLQNLLLSDALLCHLDAADAAEVIECLAAILEVHGVVRSTFSAAVLEREKTMPTGLPLAATVNAALPHADIEHVVRPGLAVATLAHPVLFHAMDDPEQTVPVSLVFLLALSEPHAQIEMLQTLATILQSRKAVERIYWASTADDLRAAMLAGDALQEQKEVVA